MTTGDAPIRGVAGIVEGGSGLPVDTGFTATAGAAPIRGLADVAGVCGRVDDVCGRVGGRVDGVDAPCVCPCVCPCDVWAVSAPSCSCLSCSCKS